MFIPALTSTYISDHCAAYEYQWMAVRCIAMISTVASQVAALRLGCTAPMESWQQLLGLGKNTVEFKRQQQGNKVVISDCTTRVDLASNYLPNMTRGDEIACRVIEPLVQLVAAAQRDGCGLSFIKKQIIREGLACLRATITASHPAIWQPLWISAQAIHWLARLAVHDREAAVRAGAIAVFALLADPRASLTRRMLADRWPEGAGEIAQRALDSKECYAARQEALRFITAAALLSSASADGTCIVDANKFDKSKTCLAVQCPGALREPLLVDEFGIGRALEHLQFWPSIPSLLSQTRATSGFLRALMNLLVRAAMADAEALDEMILSGPTTWRVLLQLLLVQESVGARKNLPSPSFLSGASLCLKQGCQEEEVNQWASADAYSMLANIAELMEIVMHLRPHRQQFFVQQTDAVERLMSTFCTLVEIEKQSVCMTSASDTRVWCSNTGTTDVHERQESLQAAGSEKASTLCEVCAELKHKERQGCTLQATKTQVHSEREGHASDDDGQLIATATAPCDKQELLEGRFSSQYEHTAHELQQLSKPSEILAHQERMNAVEKVAHVLNTLVLHGLSQQHEEPINPLLDTPAVDEDSEHRHPDEDRKQPYGQTTVCLPEWPPSQKRIVDKFQHLNASRLHCWNQRGKFQGGVVNKARKSSRHVCAVASWLLLESMKQEDTPSTSSLTKDRTIAGLQFEMHQRLLEEKVTEYSSQKQLMITLAKLLGTLLSCRQVQSRSFLCGGFSAELRQLQDKSLGSHWLENNPQKKLEEQVCCDLQKKQQENEVDTQILTSFSLILQGSSSVITDNRVSTGTTRIPRSSQCGGPRSGMTFRPPTAQGRMAQAPRTRGQSKGSANQEPPRREPEPERRKEVVEAEEDDDEDEQDDRLHQEEDRRAEQRAKKRGAQEEVEPVLRDAAPKKKKYAVRLEDRFDVEKVIDRLLKGHNDLMTLKEILASAPKLRDGLKGRLLRRLVPSVHLSVILPNGRKLGQR
ncbi:hypothetical protein CBR_g50045 [Chara braunii]|uniref:Uncharacterized protein n=1 Tax=Chara braunii TaxID=69332 RepID=A0A388M617_CHABU|nr:hypothetical protein CBR_g50045 [Chara braunii]|eukprot:GBG89955.1 hypothetical protein CBR_g50045 [Chara braunii]